ncbi:MAG: phage holin family protein [Chitinophagales bacterium]|nr:phage holin family protein [Chitinophagales bacterium]
MQSIINKTGDYIETRIELLRLKTVSKSSEVASMILANAVILILAMLFLLTFNIGIAFWIGDLLGKYAYGFLIVAAFYGVAGFLFYIFRNQWIKEPVNNFIIRKFLE